MWYVTDGDVASGWTLQYDSMTVHSGGGANSTTLNSRGILYVKDNGTVLSTTINSAGYMYVSSGGTANITKVNFCGEMHIFSGGIANNTTVNSKGLFYVSSGGTATDIRVSSGARLIFYVAKDTYITGTSGSSVFEIKDGIVSNYTVNGGSCFISSGGVVTSTTVIGTPDGPANLTIESGGTATDITVSSSTFFSVLSHGIANNTTVKSDSWMDVEGTVNNTVISYGGELKVNVSGIANSTIISSGGSCIVYSGGTANDTTVYYGGKVLASGTKGIIYGGRLNNTMISSGGCVIVDAIGRANNTTVRSGGSFLISSGGGIMGQTTIEDGAVVSMFSGARITFDISELTSGAEARVNDLSRIKIQGSVIYGLTVSDTQERGIYVLAEGAEGFNQTITVQNNVESLGTLTPGETIIVNDTKYSLNLNESTLLLVVQAPDTTAPTISDITASITEPTNQDVIVTATFSDNVELASSQYKIGGNGTWTDYKNGITVTENTTVYFKAVDTSENTAEASYEVTNIDKIKPVVTLAGDNRTPLQKSTLTATVDDGSKIYYRIGDSELTEYTGSFEVKSNGTYHFQATDAAGNTGTAEITFGNIDTTAPVISNVVASTTGPAKSVTVTAEFADDVDVATSLYKLGDNGLWLDYPDGGVTFYENGTVFFKAIDTAGNESEIASCTVTNIDNVAPTAPAGLDTIVSGQKVALVWDVSMDDSSGVKEYVVTYSLDEQEFTVRTSNTNYVLNNADFGDYSWSVQAVDFAGNESAVTAGEAFTVSGFKPYTVEYSADNFEHIITFAVTTPSLDAFRMPGGTYQMRVKQEDSDEWLTGDPIVSEETGDAPQLVKSDADGNADVFFANAVGTWESGYLAQHAGSIGDWGGTNEYAGLYGKNKLADIIEGSDDTNILLMSDDENGDSLFVDDIYTDLPGSIAEQQARIARIDEIRAGFGDDIVDMTSQRFEYVGDGLTIRGGDGNDVIWANKGGNLLFGDAGNDRIVGASGNDVIAGGIGNDRLHGGGGEDIFTFGENWGTDTVEQLATGKVTLWFASGDESKWDASTLTYTDGDNSVTVSGIAADRVTLKLGDDGSDQFAALSGIGAFFDATSERIFEESGKGILASL